MATVVGNAGNATRLLRTVDATPTNRLGADSQIVLPALVIGGTILTGMALEFAPLTTIAALAAIVVALVSPAVGLATDCVHGAAPAAARHPGARIQRDPRRGRGARLRLPPPDRSASAPPDRADPAPVGFVLYVGVQQTPEMVAGYAGSVGLPFVLHLQGVAHRVRRRLGGGVRAPRTKPLPLPRHRTGLGRTCRRSSPSSRSTIQRSVHRSPGC